MVEIPALYDDISMLITGVIFALAISIASFCWAVEYQIRKKRAMFRRNSFRATTNFNQESFSSLAYFSHPFFHVYKDAAYSVASISTSKSKPVSYSLFYFKRNLGLPGGLINNRPESAYSLRGDAKKFGINHYGSNKIKEFEPGLIKEIFGGRDVFIEVSNEGVVLGFRPVAAGANEMESMYSQCNELMWKAAAQKRAA